MQKRIKKRRPVRTAVLLLLVLVVLFVGILVLTQWKNIMRIYKGVKYSSDEISSMQQENDKKTNELLNELAVETMRDLTDEERKLLASGELSESDAISLIQGLMPPLGVITTTESRFEPDEPVETVGHTVSADSEGNTAAVTSATTKKEPSEIITTTTTVAKNEAAEPLSSEDSAKLQNRISEIIAEIYLLRATYLNKIDELIATTKAEYIALPSKERTLRVKMQFVEKKITPKGKALEAACDASMDKLLTELDGIIKKLELKSSIVDEIKIAYKEQKDLKMAELYSKYASKLK